MRCAMRTRSILSRGNVDARETSLGGDRIDLGGFRRFVHAHDQRQEVRLRVDLSLEGWQVPAPVREKMRHSGEFADEWPEEDDPARLIRSGWVTLAVAWNGWKEKPMLASYQIGVNESPIGRIVQSPDLREEVNLEFNRGHPLFDRHGRGASASSSAGTGQVREAADPGAERSLDGSIPLSGQTTPLPDCGTRCFP